MNKLKTVTKGKRIEVYSEAEFNKLLQEAKRNDLTSTILFVLALTNLITLIVLW